MSWEFHLVEKLGFRTVEELRNTMSNREFLQWIIYYKRQQQERELASLQGGS